MYADDLVILSRSKTGLQNCLNALSLNCDKWKLKINPKKKKIIISQKRPKKSIDIKLNIGSESIEIVKESGPYLGFFVCGGKLGFREISDQYSYKKQPSKIRHYVRKKTFSFPGGGNCPLRPPAMYGPEYTYLGTTFNSNGKLALEHLKEKALHAFSSIRKQKIARDFHPSSSSIAPALAVRS